ncbi:MAG: hypothetical protein IPJ79_15615 [Bacteroidetes bacterium]|nr:hypothetical protein [Bacteroidota bacterium]
MQQIDEKYKYRSVKSEKLLADWLENNLIEYDERKCLYTIGYILRDGCNPISNEDMTYDKWIKLKKSN